jgi:hypothetical protein
MDLKGIIEIGKKIGFTRCSTSFSFPCCLELNNKVKYDFVTIILGDLYNDSEFKLSDIKRVNKSKFALSKELRIYSMNVQDFKGDYPIFLRTRKGDILGYNAISEVDFTFTKQILGKDIINIIDFDTARAEGFNLIKDHRKIGKTLWFDLPEELRKEIEK